MRRMTACDVRIVVAALPLASVVASGCATRHPDLAVAPKPRVINVGERAMEIIPGTGVYDSPVLSPDGRRLAVQIEVYRDPVLPYEVYSLAIAEKDRAGRWRDTRIIRRGVYRQLLGLMSMPVQPSFDHTGEKIYCTRIEFFSCLSIPWASTLRSWIELVDTRQPDVDAVRIVEHADFGFQSTELIQHPRVSPDGRWLTFYTRVHRATQGVYVLDLTTGDHYRLGSTHDKHPTWSPDGRRIYFHHSKGGKRHRFDFLSRGEERSVLGFFELEFDLSGRLDHWRRRLFDDLDRGFIYHKHPTEVSGMDLLFFHGRLKPGGRMKLMVRSTALGSRAYVVTVKFKAKKLKAAKHPCSSYAAKDLIFIGKPKGEKKYRLMLSLKPSALNMIDKTVHAQPGKPTWR